jgi:Uma2 family endonuclease
MATVLPASVLPADWTAADMLTHLGGIPLERIRMYPPPGTATEADVLAAKNRIHQICELTVGILVAKVLSFQKALLTTELTYRVLDYAKSKDLGIVLGPAGPLRLSPERIVIPDVSFICWEKFPNRRLPRDSIYAVAPDLAIEVLSEGNTRAEMSRKLRDYFTAGVRLVWYIDPKTRSAQAFTTEDHWVDVSETQSLSGGEVLPGFELSLKDLFAKADEERPV